MSALPRTYGQHGKLVLRLGLKDNRTIIKDAYNSGPMKIAKPFYLEPGTGGIYLCQMCTGGGLVQGDVYHQEITLEPGTRAVITTQSATKIYRMHTAFARQVNKFIVGRDAFLEYFPEPLVPFAKSRYVGETEVYLEDGATIFLGEIITPGRTARGEVFQFDFYNSITRIYWENELIFLNNQILTTKRDLKSLGLYDGYTHQGSFLIFSEKVSQRLSENLYGLFENRSDLLVGSSLTLKNGISVRILGTRADSIEEAIYSCWELARREIAGLPGLNLRKVGRQV